MDEDDDDDDGLLAIMMVKPSASSPLARDTACHFGRNSSQVCLRYIQTSRRARDCKSAGGAGQLRQFMVRCRPDCCQVLEWVPTSTFVKDGLFRIAILSSHHKVGKRSPSAIWCLHLSGGRGASTTQHRVDNVPLRFFTVQATCTCVLRLSSSMYVCCVLNFRSLSNDQLC